MDKIIKDTLKMQKNSNKSALENAQELLQNIEIQKKLEKKQKQTQWNLNYQKTEKYKQYKKEYMRKYKLQKLENSIIKFISNIIEKKWKKYKNNIISHETYLKSLKKHSKNIEILQELTGWSITFKEYKKKFIDLYGKENYNDLVL